MKAAELRDHLETRLRTIPAIQQVERYEYEPGYTDLRITTVDGTIIELRTVTTS